MAADGKVYLIARWSLIIILGIQFSLDLSYLTLLILSWSSSNFHPIFIMMVILILTDLLICGVGICGEFLLIACISKQKMNLIDWNGL